MRFTRAGRCPSLAVMPTLLCYGDSNTHGTPPIADMVERDPRYAPDVRWPGVCAATLGSDWTLIEEGLGGRTAQFPDPIMGDHMDGRLGLKIALNSHVPIDMLTIMLGTNDVKMRYGANPEAIAGGMAALLDIALQIDLQAKHGGFDILLICPPPVEEVGVLAGEFYGGAAKSRALPDLYRRLAEARGIGFLDAGACIAVSPVDGVHFDATAHAALAGAVAAAVAE